jgi:hypothetical protein
MAKSDVTQEQARAVIDRVAQEVGLLVAETSGFVKVQGPTNKHRIYVQRSRTLNRIDTTLPFASDDPAYKALPAPNGSVTCQIQPSLENLERGLRMLADASLGTQVPNKPRPFAATKAPARRVPKPVEEPLAESDMELASEGPSTKDLKDRIAKIRASAKAAKIRRYVENHGLTEQDAESVADGHVTLESLIESVDNAASSEALDILSESGIEVYSN